jgi:hypothetical protein
MNTQNDRQLPPIVLPDKRQSTGQQDKQIIYTSDHDDDLGLLLRFLIGSLLEGNRQLVNRIAEWETALRQQNHSMPDKFETDLDRARYLLIGLLFEARDAVTHQANRLLTESQKGRNRVRRWLSPLLDNRLMRPITTRLDDQISRLDHRVNRIINRGRAEENLGRQVASKAYTAILDEFLDHLSHNPEVMAMIRQQSVDLAGNVITSVREVSIEADDRLENLVWSFLGRRSRQKTTHNAWKSSTNES